MMITINKTLFVTIYTTIVVSIVYLLLISRYSSTIFVKGFSNHQMIPRMNNNIRGVQNEYTILKRVDRKVLEQNKYFTYKTEKYKSEEHHPLTINIDYEIPNWVYKKVFKFNKNNYNKYKS